MMVPLARGEPREDPFPQMETVNPVTYAVEALRDALCRSQLEHISAMEIVAAWLSEGAAGLSSEGDMVHRSNSRLIATVAGPLRLSDALVDMNVVERYAETLLNRRPVLVVSGTDDTSCWSEVARAFSEASTVGGLDGLTSGLAVKREASQGPDGSPPVTLRKHARYGACNVASRFTIRTSTFSSRSVKYLPVNDVVMRASHTRACLII